VSLLSNPSMIEIEGVKILLFHGQGFEVIAGDIGVGIQSPPEITVQVLKNRHLCPIWDQISNFPTEEDELVIESTPDILVTGHLHVADYREYKGTLLLNPSAFQGKTSWQRELGIEPTPGLFPIVDLKNFKVKFLDFNC
ncbi:MAG: DNA polymerase II small subunit, partial [Candidatus Thorarchaeota archaeon]|nr:DNA polymerase II small subunit [Candidatus Thorarchaeota archaeon]NIW14740.1 DNA polymerase II small subunit [Candidatus Thorarchaeota archaeon]NIW52566.1 DNA polymerase II small subunit [Candidatus Korarchaeota archaeon]